MVALENVLQSVESPSELRALMRVLFTPAEIRKYRKRWSACQMSAGGATQRKIRDTLHVGVATATRAAKTARENRHILRLLLERK